MRQKSKRWQVVQTRSQAVAPANGRTSRNRAVAMRAIRQRCAGFTARQYRNAFSKSLELYEEVQQLVQEDAEQLWAAQKSGDDSWPQRFDSELTQRCPGFRVSTLRKMVGMSFYYWHLR